MTVTMQKDAPRSGSQRQVEFGGELLEQQACVGHAARLLLQLSTQQQRNIFLYGREAAGLAKQNLLAAVCD